MRIYNTPNRKVENFTPLNPPKVTFYACGPTVYDFTHIGHIRTYINEDVLKRTLERAGYQVDHVMNITDVGHLTGDDDSGSDKLERGAQKEGKSVWDIAKFYTEDFEKSMKAVNVNLPKHFIKATDHIKQMVALIKKLQEKGLAYETEEAVYFDSAKFKNYGKFSGQNLEDKKQGAREEVHVDSKKKHPADFALWFKTVGRFADHTMKWESPWGEGFPGWHIECSAMAMEYLGETIDIHAGGIDHIPVHHENEIAQAEGATGKLFVRYWFHSNFLTVDGEKMSKSKRNFYTVADIKKKSVDPLALRLLFLQSHYRQLANFTWEAAEASQSAYTNLKAQILQLKSQSDRTALSPEKLVKVDDLRNRFNEALFDDLQTPKAVAVLWEVVKSSIPSPDKLDLLLDFDQVLGLNLAQIEKENIPSDVVELAEQRLDARNKKDFELSDTLRQEIEKKGYVVEDSGESYTLKKK